LGKELDGAFHFVELQKSSYTATTYYINVGVSVKSSPVDRLDPHLFKRLGSNIPGDLPEKYDFTLEGKRPVTLDRMVEVVREHALAFLGTFPDRAAVCEFVRSLEWDAVGVHRIVQEDCGILPKTST
jgi:hypothetical protein